MDHPFPSYDDLYDLDGLGRLHTRFRDVYGQTMSALAETHDILSIAQSIQNFIINLFHINNKFLDLKHSILKKSSLKTIKRDFIRRYVLYHYTPDQAIRINGQDIILSLNNKGLDIPFPLSEDVFSHVYETHQHDSGVIESLAAYAAWAIFHPDGRSFHADEGLFSPAQVLPAYNDRLNATQDAGYYKGASTLHRHGFDLYDPGIGTSRAIDQATYCLKCHTIGKDSCSTGLKNNQGQMMADPGGRLLGGCPLDQKISEMNVLFESGDVIAALAVIMMDNPLVPLTGHRICNDCMASCIFQKQDPVDVPSIETHILRLVLGLPWGFEIYSLLCRWNPLLGDHALPCPPTGYTTLIVGQGPAGISLAHYLLRLGHGVVAIDGLKIDPLPDNLVGPNARLIRDTNSLWHPVDQRPYRGFGGVAEYGITARWDKNFLHIVRIVMARWERYRLYDSIRFGSEFGPHQAFENYGFDHISLAMGAASPHHWDIKNAFAPGIRQASDFLMSLHLTGASHPQSRNILPLRLPCVVVGGGLTAIDAATEAMAYYPLQVMRFYERYMMLEQSGHSASFWDRLSAKETNDAKIFLTHGQQLTEEKNRAAKAGVKPNYAMWVQSWGGVTILYRRDHRVSPAYRLNVCEMNDALAQGVWLCDNSTVSSIQIDDEGDVAGIHTISSEGIPSFLPARTVLTALGTRPHTSLVDDAPDVLNRDGDFFHALDDTKYIVGRWHDGRTLSVVGDVHPHYTGSVVKALASSKYGAPILHNYIIAYPPVHTWEAICATMDHDFQSCVINNQPGDDGSRLLTIRSPFIAHTIKPGQYVRVDTYANGDPKRMIEAVALYAYPDAQKDTLMLRIYPIGLSTQTLGQVSDGMFLSVMGPNGKNTDEGGVAVPALMQCMMGGICAQCMIRCRDGATGKDKLIFACTYPQLPEHFIDQKEALARTKVGRMEEIFHCLFFVHFSY